MTAVVIQYALGIHLVTMSSCIKVNQLRIYNEYSKLMLASRVAWALILESTAEEFFQV
jgi:hypothetical protein